MEFKIGDKVKLIGEDWDDCQEFAKVGNTYSIVADSKDTTEFFTQNSVEIKLVEDYPEDFELDEEHNPFNEDSITPQQIEGIARPILTERKNDKVMIQLVDDGFPNALWELAKLMSWANNHKGYLPHDWKNLPNAEVEFAAAASRHRMKPKLGEKYDPESKLLHKAHEAFNVLAELELMLTGKIDTE